MSVTHSYMSVERSYSSVIHSYESVSSSYTPVNSSYESVGHSYKPVECSYPSVYYSYKSVGCSDSSVIHSYKSSGGSKSVIYLPRLAIPLLKVSCELILLHSYLFPFAATCGGMWSRVADHDEDCLRNEPKSYRSCCRALGGSADCENFPFPKNQRLHIPRVAALFSDRCLLMRQTFPFAFYFCS